MKKGRENNHIIMQGSLLAAASILSRIIGMVYRIPLTRILGNNGNGFYAVAYDIYNMALLLSSFGLPLAVSKLVAAKVGKGEHKNAWKVFQCAVCLALLLGTVSSLVIFFGAGFITGNIMNSAMSVYALQTLAPALFVLALMGVIRGYFQGLGTMVPTAASQIIEQLVNAFVSVFAAEILLEKGLEIASGNKHIPYAYAAAGGTLGTSSGSAAAMIVLVILLLVYQKSLKKQINKDKTLKKDKSADIFQLLIWTIVPVALSTIVYNLSTTVDQGIFNFILKDKMSYEKYNALWGIFAGKYKLLINVPVAIASAMSSTVIPSLTMAAQQKNKAAVSEKINMTIRFTMVIIIPCAVGMAVLAGPILNLIFGDTSQTAANLMRYGSIAVVFYSLSTLTNGILQGINRMRIPVRNAILSLVINISILSVLLTVFDMHIYAQLIAFNIFGLFMCVLNAYGISKHSSYKQEIKRTFIIPACAALIMGGSAYLTYIGITKLLSCKLAVIFTIIAAVLVYGIMLLVMKEFTREELLNMPKGYLIVSIAEKLKLI